MDAALKQKLSALRNDIDHAAVFVDFDGTLSPIVLDPATSRPLPGAVEALNALADRAGTVAVVSGRPVAFLFEKLAVKPTVHLRGLYGLQWIADGAMQEDASVSRWRELVDAGAITAESQLPKGLRVERKGVTFVLHYRSDPSLRELAEEWAAKFATTSGLDAHKGRQSIEIGPLSMTDKGVIVTELCKGLRRSCVIGDDTGDLPMFDAARVATPGKSLSIVVQSDETPQRLLDMADVTVDGPPAVVEALQFLAS